MAELPDGWIVWNEEPESRLVLAYRPDVFDSAAFPAACLPTITVAPGDGPNQLPERRAWSASWYRAIFLEPAVRIRDVEETYGSWEEAVAGAHELAEQFAAGELDYRAAYQEPREEYLVKLDELMKGSDSGDEDAE